MASTGEVSQGEEDSEDEVQKKPEIPLYSMQALWDGKMSLKDFEVKGEEKLTLPHDVFEHDEALPVIDISALLGTDKKIRDENMAAMLDAAKTWGFFKIRNHGVPLEVVKKVESNVKNFFALPMEKKLMVKAINFAFGYVGGSPVSWRYKWWLEGLHMKVNYQAIRDMVNLVWSDDKDFAEEFISDLTSYFDTMRYLSRLIVECLTEGLSLPRDTYTKLETENAICNARVNHYPACPDPSKVFGIPGHTDPQMLSILYQDDVGGLQVLKDGKWIGIRPDDSTLVCNLGDTFQAIEWP
uniref:Fe2OG dioxygenase domain-containing protein n=1 Tax=Physcomitrium patens TaxID=3218 RepID=A0A7I4B8D7_PHYPA